MGTLQKYTSSMCAFAGPGPHIFGRVAHAVRGLSTTFTGPGTGLGEERADASLDRKRLGVATCARRAGGREFLA